MNEEDLKWHADRISCCNQWISQYTTAKREHEAAISKIRSAERLEGMSKTALVLAAKHLTPGEGPMREGYVVTRSDMLALAKVIDFVSEYARANP